MIKFIKVSKSLLRICILVILFFCFGKKPLAQGTLADYQRAEAMNGLKENKVYNAPDKFEWLKSGKEFWYTKLTNRGKEFIKVNVENKKATPLFDQEKLAEALNTADVKTEAYHLHFSDLKWIENGRSIQFETGDTTWTYNLQLNKLTSKINSTSAESNNYKYRFANRMKQRAVSPDGNWQAFIKNYNVYIRPAKDSTRETALSFDGNEGNYYSPYLSWSPDSKKITTNKIIPGKDHIVYLIESSPTDQLQPKLHSRNYLKPGDTLEQRQPCIFLIDSKKELLTDPAQILSQYEVSYPEWRKDSHAVTFEYNQRGHQQYKIMELSIEGKTRDIIKEESKTFIDYSGKEFRHDVNDGKEIIWASERDGWNHLYLYDGNGKLKNQITKGNWVVRDVVNVDEANRTILFTASGKEPGQDPYFLQYYRINFDGTGLVTLTNEDGNHTATFSPDYKYFVDNYSRIDMPQTTLLRNASNGKIIMPLEKADISALLNTGWKMPEVFVSKGRDGVTDIWGMIVRPGNFDPTKNYPVIEYIYAGPHSSFVPKSFVTDSRGSLHELAELGFIVVQIDGMGTSNRSKAFHDVCWKNLKDAGFPDRIPWIKAAAKKYPYMNIDKVGIFGNSAGGQSSLGALLLHPDFYKVAVSSSGCHDNRMDKIWWNEQWMGYPIGPQYAASSNVTLAPNLQGKLLLILGELDENVDPSSTMQVINALIKANKNFDFLIVPGMGHSLGGDYGEHKRRDFFVKNLLGVEPPAWTWKQSITVPKP